MRRALEEYHIVGVKTNIPFHQRIMDSRHFITGEFDTRFVEERFSMNETEGGLETMPHIAAIMATLVSHHQTQRVAQIVRQDDHGKRGWKWAGRMERLER
jgi:acetyl/propionyl-CoA carboxylase alpha subunit